MSEELTESQLRKVADYLYDGEFNTLPLMQQIKQFKRGDRVLFWLFKNKIRGKKMLEFFQTESDNEDNRGVLLGVQTALRFSDGGMPYLTARDLV